MTVKSASPTTGWVSENYLAFCRISKWYLYGMENFDDKGSSKKQNVICQQC